ncbi:MAG: hypothetical protein AAB927_00325 [Patescibacteria group bacterium]
MFNCERTASLVIGKLRSPYELYGSLVRLDRLALHLKLNNFTTIQIKL